MLIELIISLITFTLNSLLGLIVILRNHKSWTNRLLFFTTLVISAYTIVNFLSLHPPIDTPASQLFWIRMVMSVTAFLGPSIFLLVHTFPGSKIKLKFKYLIPLIFLAVVTSITSLTPGIFASITYPQGVPVPQPGILMPLFLIDFAGLVLLSFVILITKYKKSTGLEKVQLRYLVFGVVLTFSLLAITGFFFVILLKVTSFVVLSPFYSFILIASISYAILKHRLLDINALVTRTVAFVLLLFLTTSLYAAVLLSAPLILPPNIQFFFTVISALILAFTFNPLRKLLQNTTEGLLHNKGYQSEKVLEKLSDTIRSTLSIDTLTNQVSKQLKPTLHVSRLAFIFLHNDKQTQLVNHGFKNQLQLTPKHIKKLAALAKSSILVYEELGKGETKSILQKNKINIVIPIKTSNQTLGIIVLGEKTSGDIYTSQDLNVLEIAGPQISIAIQNSLAYDEIKRFNVTLRQKIKEATKDLRKANRDLRHLDKLKDEFVYIATHELKTPVTVLKGYMSMINKGTFGQVPKSLKEPLGEMEVANGQLVQLVNDLLEIARAEAKTIKINTQPVDLIPLINSTVKNLKPLASQKHLKLQHHQEKETKLMVQADQDRLKEILNNLVSNAIKYSDSGTINISHVIEDKKMVVTHVTDQGHGISKKDQEKIFTRFFRAEEVAGKAPGTGLGLFIVKQLVEKMGGKIWFQSKLKQGTTFSFSLPKANTPESSQ